MNTKQRAEFNGKVNGANDHSLVGQIVRVIWWIEFKKNEDMKKTRTVEYASIPIYIVYNYICIPWVASEEMLEDDIHKRLMNSHCSPIIS
jgi:hypothetical protein